MTRPTTEKKKHGMIIIILSFLFHSKLPSYISASGWSLSSKTGGYLFLDCMRLCVRVHNTVTKLTF